MKKEKEILEKNRRDYNLIADHFSKTRENPWKDLKFLFEDIPKGGKVLDLGCGNGRFYQVVENEDVEYFGLDKSENLIIKAKERYPKVDFKAGDALNIPFPDEEFDVVVSVAVLHHMPTKKTRVKFLKEAKRVLKKGGSLRISVWNLLKNDKSIYVSDFWEKVKGNIGLKDAFIPWKNSQGDLILKRYYHFFTRRELKKVAKEAGLKKIEIIEKGEGSKANIILLAEK